MNYVTQTQPLPTFSASREAVWKFIDQPRENSGRKHFLRLNYKRPHMYVKYVQGDPENNLYLSTKHIDFFESVILNLNYLNQGQPLAEVSFFKYVALGQHLYRELTAGKGY